MAAEVVVKPSFLKCGKALDLKRMRDKHKTYFRKPTPNYPRASMIFLYTLALGRIFLFKVL